MKLSKGDKVTFPGGCYYTEYHKDGDGIIIQGNYDEGYNIFIINNLGL